MAALVRAYRLGKDDDLGIVAGNRICGELSTIAALISAVSIISGWPAIAADVPLSERKSGYQFLARETRAMQDDDTANPGMLWVLDGEALWNRKVGKANKSCADCHNDASTSMKGVAARYPAFNEAANRPIDLEQRINICRTDQQNATPLLFESNEMLALAGFVGRQSRGMPIAVSDDERTKPFIQAGRAMFERRQGQLNLSCAQCHDDNWGAKLAGVSVPQGHPTGYPLYRLEWQAMGSLQRRLRNCLIGMRAQAYAFGAPEYVNLELFLMWRARGMAIETPAVRP
ncbi:MAG: sulfur oxidation c-type cytochrome SoxA [Xanthobacteraceae bacterium]